MDDATLLPSLFAPQELRWSKARERFFCDFQRPTGLVRDAVIQSWERCLLGGRKTEEAIVLRTISHSALKSVIRRSQRLIDAASPVLAHLEIALEGAGCCISLVNADGLIVRSSPARRLTGEILRRLSRPGVDISENAIGTSAPGIALKTGQLARVEGGEHFFEGQAMIRCVAVPIRYARGMLAGALNVATEARSFGFDPGPILATYASIIENRILRAQPIDHFLLKFQFDSSLLGTALEGLAGVRQDGTLAWLNSVGEQLIGTRSLAGVQKTTAESAFGLTVDELGRRRAHTCQTEFTHTLPNGLLISLVVSDALTEGRNDEAVDALVAGDTTEGGQVTALGKVGHLAIKERLLILEALEASKGNVSLTARRLGVSRGKVYRALHDSRSGG